MVNFLQTEDFGALELEVEIEGCVIPKVPVDGGSGVNIMLEDTAFELGYTMFEPMTQVLRLADQSRVVPVGHHSQIPAPDRGDHLSTVLCSASGELGQTISDAIRTAMAVPSAGDGGLGSEGIRGRETDQPDFLGLREVPR